MSVSVSTRLKKNDHSRIRPERPVVEPPPIPTEANAVQALGEKRRVIFRTEVAPLGGAFLLFAEGLAPTLDTQPQTENITVERTVASSITISRPAVECHPSSKRVANGHNHRRQRF